MKVTPAAASVGFGPIKTGFTTPSRARRAAASRTRGSGPSGNTMVFFCRRARSMSPDMKCRADSGIVAIYRNLSLSGGGLIAEEFAERPQAVDVVADGLESGGERDRQQQARSIPEESPEHQG